MVFYKLPCNQFLEQEPCTNEEIQNFCSLTYNVTFPLFDKVDVNGKKESPLYTFLKSKAPFTGYPEGYEAFAAQLDMIQQKTGSGFDKGDAIKWNFGKFLVSKDARPSCVSNRWCHRRVWKRTFNGCWESDCRLRSPSSPTRWRM